MTDRITLGRGQGILRALRRLAKLGRNRSGVAASEFGLIMPVVISLGMYGTEIAYMSSVSMQVSQLALSVADNASRLGQADNSAVTPTVTENDLTSIMKGAVKQGASINFQTRGRIILSSLEKDPATGKQFIHWQRCVGGLARVSAYGNDTTQNGLVGASITGMGTGTNTIAAPSTTTSVMFVEVFYTYRGIFGTLFVNNMEFKQEAAYLTRDDRNLTPGITGTGNTTACT